MISIKYKLGPLSTTLLLFIFFAGSWAKAERQMFCGTEHQWPTDNQSGWFFNIDITAGHARVVKAESQHVTRSFNYKIMGYSHNQIQLNSEFHEKKAYNFYDIIFNK